MRICHGISRRPIPLHSTRKYIPEEIFQLCKGSSPPYYIRVENTDIPINTEDAFSLACEITSAYHNWVAYNAPDNDTV